MNIEEKRTILDNHIQPLLIQGIEHLQARRVYLKFRIVASNQAPSYFSLFIRSGCWAQSTAFCGEWP